MLKRECKYFYQTLKEKIIPVMLNRFLNRTRQYFTAHFMRPHHPINNTKDIIRNEITHQYPP